MLLKSLGLSGKRTVTMKPVNGLRDATALYKLAGLYNISLEDLLHLTVNIDRDEVYDAPKPTQASSELAEYLKFYNDPANKKKYIFHSDLEKKMLFYFSKISDDDKRKL